MRQPTARLSFLLLCLLLLPLTQRAEGITLTFAPGDVFVSLESGEVQWRHPDGTLNQVLTGKIPAKAMGMGFDGAGNLYVTRWCAYYAVTGDPTCAYNGTGNTVEKFDTTGTSQGSFGSGYDCNPHDILFDAVGNAYVGQADCTGAILKFAPGMPSVAFAVAPDIRGSFWIDLAADGCTLFYTSWGPNVKRFNVCTGLQLPDFNVAPLPGGEAQGLRILPDGGVLVSGGQVLSRLDASGNLVQTYSVADTRLGLPVDTFWFGIDLVGDGSFWAANYFSSNVYRFDLATGTVLSSFNAARPTPPGPYTGVDVNVMGVIVKK